MIYADIELVIFPKHKPTFDLWLQQHPDATFEDKLDFVNERHLDCRIFTTRFINQHRILNIDSIQKEK